jgi:hypothetical protein
MDLRVVKDGRYLHFPEAFGPIENRGRGGPGHCVNLDAPFEREWCKGQEHKLEPAPKGAMPNAIVHPIALRMIRDLDAKPKAAAPAAQPTGKPIQADLPSVDLPKKTPAKV